MRVSCSRSAKCICLFCRVFGDPTQAFEWPRYVFPGLAFGAHLAKNGVVTDDTLTSAAEALANLLSDVDVKAGRVYPTSTTSGRGCQPVEWSRDSISCAGAQGVIVHGLRGREGCLHRVAADVAKTAHAEGHCHDARTVAKGGVALLHRVLKMWQPEYRSILSRPAYQARAVTAQQ